MRQLMMAMAVAGLAIGMAGCGGGKVIARVECGGTQEYVDQTGAKWAADQEYTEAAKWGAMDGKTITRTTLKTIAGTQAPQVYLTERYQMPGYRFDLPKGKYTVRLHFAETYEGITKVGERVFTVKVQGQPVLEDFDVMKAAGGFAKPVIKEFRGVAVTDGKLMIEFVPKVQNAEINGIEILAD